MLLPHGYEGQGPDHSSGRIERYLGLAANDQLTIAQPSTPASYFHLLRRQAWQEEHRPLIVFTPKSMLRLKAAASQPEDFTSGTFLPVIGDDSVDPNKVERVILCSGKIAWELFAERAKVEGDSPKTAIVRIEQLYPRPVKELNAAVAKFPNAREVRWVQDEPANQGAWPHYALHMTGEFDGLPFVRVSRPALTAPSVGSLAVHNAESRALLDQAFT